MFKAERRTEIVLGGDLCPDRKVITMEASALCVVAPLELGSLPARVTETLTPKVAKGLEPQLRSWQVYPEEKTTWASQIVCEQECQSEICTFASMIAETEQGLDSQVLKEATNE